MITIPSGVIPVHDLTTDEVLYGDRTSEYRWEVLAHSGGTDHLVGFLDGVVDQSAKLKWESNQAVKGTGQLQVSDLEQAGPGLLRIGDQQLAAMRLRPVLIVDGLPEIPWGAFLISTAKEDWSGTGRVFNLTLHDRSTVLDQDRVDETFAVDTSTPILSAVASVIASAGEHLSIDATVANTLSAARVWPVGTTKLQIVNDLLDALGYSSLWVDGQGEFQATPRVLPADRPEEYELLNGVKRELVDGETSIYGDEWTRDQDMFDVPNKVIAVQTAMGDAEPLRGEWTNTDADSPFSYSARGNRWLVDVLENVDTPDGTDAEIEAFLDAKARASLVASSSSESTVEVTHLPIPVRVSDVLRFANTPAGIDARHVESSISLEAYPLGLMTSKLQEVVSL